MLKPKLDFTGERLIPEINKNTAFYYEHLCRYIFASSTVKDLSVLDAGCGTGYGSYVMAKFGKAKKIYAIDSSAESIKYAQQKYRHRNINYTVDTVQKLKTIPDKTIDLAVSFEVIEHIKEQQQFLQKIKQKLSPNGVLIVSTPNKYNYPEGNKFHKKELYPKEFAKLLYAFFQHITFYYQTFELAQIIRKNGTPTHYLEEEFSQYTSKLLSPLITDKNSQYLIAVCSDKKGTDIRPTTISAQKVDSFDLSQGTLSLSKQFSSLVQEIETIRKSKILSNNGALKKQISLLKKENSALKNDLYNIQSAKFYKLWQSYTKFKSSIFHFSR